MRRSLNARRQRGASLIEALLAFLVLALGMLGMAKLQGQLRLNAELARDRTEALRLAQEDMEAMRAFTTPASYADILPAAHGIAGVQSNTAYQLDRSVATMSGLRSPAVHVGWTDRSGQQQQVTLQSIIAGTPPALSGALVAQGAGQLSTAMQGRSPFVPVQAKDLGNGTSAIKPSAAAGIVFVIDNISGTVTSVCTGAPANLQTQDLTLSALQGCTMTSGLLLSGIVRLSLAAPPDAAHANDVPLPLSVAVALTGATYPSAPVCASEARSSNGERFVAYHCAIATVQGVWSGRSTLVPQGWSIGTTAQAFRVCRYASDQDGSGAVDQNAEHPNEYQHVVHNLMQQNFLIVKGDQACPAAPSGADAVQVSYATVQHQP
jgi:Tfp pilus assembly protein PilV